MHTLLLHIKSHFFLQRIKHKGKKILKNWNNLFKVLHIFKIILKMLFKEMINKKSKKSKRKFKKYIF